MMLWYFYRTEWRSILPATIAINIRLPEELLKALKYRAIEEKKSVNQIIREAIEMFLVATPQPEQREMDPFEDIIGIARSGIKDASSKHDRYLYEAGRDGNLSQRVSSSFAGRERRILFVRYLSHL